MNKQTLKQKLIFPSTPTFILKSNSFIKSDSISNICTKNKQTTYIICNKKNKKQNKSKQNKTNKQTKK